MRRNGWIVTSIVAIALLLLGGRIFTALFVNKLWFAALGAEPVFWEQIQDTALLRGGLFVAGSLFAFLNLHAVRRTIKAVAMPSRIADLEVIAMLPSRQLLYFTIGTAVFIGLLLAIPFDDWTIIAMARHGIPFREIEFYFQRDLGYYVYWLPLEQMLYVWCLLAIVVLMAVVIVLYALMRSLRLDGRRIAVSKHARRHLTVLGSLMVAMLAWSYRLDGFDLLRYGSGVDGLFLRVDHVVAVKIDFALSVFTLFAAMLLLRTGWAAQLRMATFTLGAVLIAAIGVRHGVPLLLSRGTMIGEPVRRELDYISTRALFSRRAYDVDGMTVTASDSVRQQMKSVELRDLPRVVSVWDAGPLMRALAGSSPTVPAAALSWAPANDALQGWLLQRPASGDGNWTLTTVSATEADDRGAPVHDGIDLGDVLDSSSVTMTSDVSAGSISAPLIAPGATGHRLVIDSTTRIVGARLDREGTRIAHAWATRDPRLLSRDETGVIPTLVMWRDVRERVRKLAPVFAQGEDILPLVHEGALFWVVELYSASEMYPLSQRWMLAGDVRSYFRHAATALVHSRTGRVRLITVNKPDPVARTWMQLAPDLFVPVERLATSLQELLPPPTDGTVAQARALARYGSRMEGEAVRHLPDSLPGMDSPPGLLLVGALPAAGWSIPLLNNGPEQITGLAVSVGGAHRGTRWMPVSKPVVRWATVVAQLHSALDSSRQSLIEGNTRREPQTAFGRVRTVLVDGQPVGVQPLYVTRINQAQALARVAVWQDGRVAVGINTYDAVRQLPGANAFAPNNGAGNSSVPFTAAARPATVARLYDTMRAAMRRGDWARLGTAFDSLGVLLGRPPQ